MQIFIFVVLWMLFSLSIPMILHVWFLSNEYPLVSIGVVIAFVGGALLSAWITGLFSDDQPSSSSSPLPGRASNPLEHAHERHIH